MSDIRLLRIADKSRENAERLFTAEIFNHPTEQDTLEARANAIRAQWICRGLPRVRREVKP